MISNFVWSILNALGLADFDREDAQEGIAKLRMYLGFLERDEYDLFAKKVMAEPQVLQYLDGQRPIDVKAAEALLVAIGLHLDDLLPEELMQQILAAAQLVVGTPAEVPESAEDPTPEPTTEEEDAESEAQAAEEEAE